jgi:hypothetical protein
MKTKTNVKAGSDTKRVGKAFKVELGEFLLANNSKA